VLVLSGDVPLVLGDQLVAIIEQRRLDDAAITLASVFAADPGELGRVVRSEFGSVERIVEARDASAEELEANEVNAGVYAFDAAWLRRRIDSLTRRRRTASCTSRSLVQLAREDGRIVSAWASTTTARSTASTTAASSPRPSGRSGCGSTRRTCAAA
jgi:bifunctional UDP-N-acetylglucosamine pyrophosphorylase/glucosamine-1-phosphate N-acetyltransferase